MYSVTDFVAKAATCWDNQVHGIVLGSPLGGKMSQHMHLPHAHVANRVLLISEKSALM